MMVTLENLKPNSQVKGILPNDTGTILSVQWHGSDVVEVSYRPFALPKPFCSTKDVFCIRHSRVADGYRRISIGGHSIQVSKIEPRQDVELHFIPDDTKNQVEIRIWALNKLVHMTHLPLDAIQKMVHL
jgi:hypothetical protein